MVWKIYILDHIDLNFTHLFLDLKVEFICRKNYIIAEF